MGRIDGRYLKDLREQNGYSLRTLAEKIYVSKSSLQRWEKSEVPDFEDVRQRLADVFNVTVDEMCMQSATKYDEMKCPVDEEEIEFADEDFELDDKSRAELKFATKWIIVPAVLLCVSAVLWIITLAL